MGRSDVPNLTRFKLSLQGLCKSSHSSLFIAALYQNADVALPRSGFKHMQETNAKPVKSVCVPGVPIALWFCGMHVRMLSSGVITQSFFKSPPQPLNKQLYTSQGHLHLFNGLDSPAASQSSNQDKTLRAASS